MSIATEITRLQNAKGAIKTAIEGKGVTVPVETKIDGYAALIGGIVASGGLPAGISEIIGGSFTPASNANSQTITHGFGAEPVGAMLWSESFGTSSDVATGAIHAICFINKPYYFKDSAGAMLNTSSTTVVGYTFLNTNGNRGAVVNTCASTGTSYVFPGTTTIIFSGHAAGIGFKAGKTYKYIVWR